MVRVQTGKQRAAEAEKKAKLQKSEQEATTTRNELGGSGSAKNKGGENRGRKEDGM